MVFDWLHKSNADYIMQESPFAEDEHARLSECFDSVMNHRKYDSTKTTQITKIFDIDDSGIQMKTNKKTKLPLTPAEIYIQQLANKYLESAGLKQNTNYFMIEYWRHRLFAETREHTFSMHRDSWGELWAPVNTCIFYLRKDNTITGGDLQLNGKHFRFDNRNTHTITTSSAKALAFDGNVFHKVLPFSGFGIRDCIVVQFEKAVKKETKLFGITISKIWYS